MTSRRRAKRLLGRRGEGGEDDLDLGGLRVGGRNQFPGVSGHWGDSGARGSSSSRSGDPLGISRMTGVSPHAGCGRLGCLQPAGPHMGCGRLNLLLEAQVLLRG